MQYENAVFCKDIGNVKPVFSPSGGTFSISPVGLSINSSTGELDVRFGALGTYVVTYFVPATAYCPAVTLKDTVTLAASATVKISMNDDFICVNEDVTLATDVVQGYSYKWTPKPYFPFGDSTATAKARIVGSGTVYVTISNSVGCMGTDSVSFSPVVCCDVMIPNAFSPNNDGLNDDFRIYTNTNQKINQISVYNRYGKRIFYSKDQNKGWDGTDNSDPLPPGVFYYFVSYECSNGEVFVKKGDVTLMR